MLTGNPDGYAGLVLAMATGCFGATFFMLANIQSRLTDSLDLDVRDMWSWPMIFLRCAVGVGAASILYFFFETGLLTGSIWPDLNRIGFSDVFSNASAPESKSTVHSVLVPNRDLALLIVWSFIAGYSQTLVPNILVRTERTSSNT